jgi:hypothetical protein
MQYKTQKPCKETGKLSFCSEAKAIRSVIKYDEIKRTYFCNFCSGFHLTSESEKLTLERGILTCEEENRLLRIYNNKLVEQNKKYKKQIETLKNGKN